VRIRATPAVLLPAGTPSVPGADVLLQLQLTEMCVQQDINIGSVIGMPGIRIGIIAPVQVVMAVLLPAGTPHVPWADVRLPSLPTELRVQRAIIIGRATLHKQRGIGAPMRAPTVPRENFVTCRRCDQTYQINVVLWRLHPSLLFYKKPLCR